MFALQRLAMLLKSTSSQICPAWVAPRQCCPVIVNDKVGNCVAGSGTALSELPHQPCMAIFSLAGWNQTWQCTWQGIFFVFEGWLDFAPVGWVAEAGLHHHCRSGWAPVITCFCFFSCYWHIFVPNINISVVLRRAAHYVVVSLMLLFCSGWQCWLCKGNLML